MSGQSRLLWRCRRGIKEMDLLLEDYVTHSYPRLHQDEQILFEAFLEEADLDILSWITGRSEPEHPAYRKFVEQLRQTNAAAPTVQPPRDNV